MSEFSDMSEDGIIFEAETLARTVELLSSLDGEQKDEIWRIWKNIHERMVTESIMTHVSPN